MNQDISFSLYQKVSELPENWNFFAQKNIFLSTEYLSVLEISAPTNMSCHFIGFFQNETLVGIAISQFLDLNLLVSFGERDRRIKTFIRNLVFRNFSSHVLLIGNNMLTGQNAYCFSENISRNESLTALEKAMFSLQIHYKKQNKKAHLSSIKDFTSTEANLIQKQNFTSYYKFSIQPNMVFSISEKWNSEQDYIDALSKKYRDQYKRARKKSIDIEKRKLNLEEILKYEIEIYNLYYHVAKNAHFNTFFLAKNHFSVLKEKLKDKFLFYAYFKDGKLIGFNTLIKNGKDMDTYFLGYDETIQREKMLYLNMLYDMIAYSINKGFKQIIFARTALEIKSSVGAKPVEMFGFIKHSNAFADKFLPKIFTYLEPDVIWKERNPFK